MVAALLRPEAEIEGKKSFTSQRTHDTVIALVFELVHEQQSALAQAFARAQRPTSQLS